MSEQEPQIAPATVEELLAALVPNWPEDLLMATRYFYYVKARPLIPDVRYDEAEKEYLARAATDTFCTPLNLPGSDKPDDYPDHIKALVFYLGLVTENKRQAHLAKKL